jgi:hypothetical protein
MGRKSEATRDTFELKKISRDPSYKRVMGNYPAKKYKKGTPAVTRLSFEFQGDGTKFIDIAAALSILNRRLYRQGLYYYVNSVEYYDNQTNVVDLHVLPDNWVTRSAHRRAKGIWDEMNQRALMSANTVLPKYHDFKVYFSSTHFQNQTTFPSLYSFNSTQTVYYADDWVYTQITTADDDGDAQVEADTFALHMLGGHNGTPDNWDSIGVIKSYGDTRRQPQTNNPSVPSQLMDDPLVNVFDYSSEEQLNDILTNLNEDNDAAPYDADTYVGELQRSASHVARLTTTPESGRVATAPGFCAPCGLIMVDPAGDSGGSNLFRIVLNLAVGTYHGVYAETI